jgi:hypothetical protein
LEVQRPNYSKGLLYVLGEFGLLKLLTAQSDGLAGLATAFFAEAVKLIDTPWWTAAIPDLIDPRVEGQRPPDLEDTLKFFGMLLKLAAQHATVHKLSRFRTFVNREGRFATRSLFSALKK